MKLTKILFSLCILWISKYLTEKSFHKLTKSGSFQSKSYNIFLKKRTFFNEMFLCSHLHRTFHSHLQPKVRRYQRWRRNTRWTPRSWPRTPGPERCCFRARKRPLQRWRCLVYSWAATPREVSMNIRRPWRCIVRASKINFDPLFSLFSNYMYFHINIRHINRNVCHFSNCLLLKGFFGHTILT